MVVLGVQVQILPEGIRIRLDDAKRDKWLKQIHEALKGEKLRPGEASKLAGRLNFASSACFKRGGRTLLYPLYKYGFFA